MSAKTWVPLGVALVLGVVAAVVARKSLLRTQASAAPPKNCSVVVAKSAISPGETLTADQLSTAPMASPTVPPDMFTRASDLVGRVTVAPLVPGQPVLQSYLAVKGSGTGLQALVPPGMRAITLDVNESSGVAGLLIPGCHVDIVTTSISTESPDRTVSRTIVQNVPVIAVGQRLSGPRGEGERDSAVSRTVTLVVSPRDAEMLDLASAAARLRLLLRSSADREQTVDDGVMLAELRGNLAGFLPVGPGHVANPIQPQPQPQPEPPTSQPTVSTSRDEHKRVITVILGNEERHVTFSGDGQRLSSPEAGQVSDNSEGTKQAVPQ